MLDFKRSNFLLFFLLLIVNFFFVIYFYFEILKETENYFTYPLDDTYIHLAMAKNFLKYKVMGINGEFASTTSSPLFTLLLSFLFLIFKDRVDLPLILNFLTSLLLIFYVFWTLQKKLSPLKSFLLTLFFYFILPVPTLLFLGLEHLLHIFFVLIFLNLVQSQLVEEKGNPLYIFILALIITSLRYESIFIIFPFLILFIFRKKTREAVLIFSGAFIPVFFYGIYSLKKGWYFLPSSLILKGYFFNFGSIEKIFLSFGTKIYNEILTNIYFLPAILLSLFILYSLERKEDFFKKSSNILAAGFFITLISHLYFAKTGWLYRYEAYLVAYSFILFSSYLFETGIKFKDSFISRASLFIIILLAFFPFFYRAYNGLKDLPVASRNIYQQQIQMAKFLQKYYRNEWVAVNDIGAVCYFKEKVLDIWGLGDVEITERMLEKTYTLNFLSDKLNRKGVKVMVVYEKIFEYFGSIPEGFVYAGEWQIKNNRVCAYDRISFFSRKEEEESIKRNLKEYSFVLPKEVIQKGKYLEE